MALQPSNKLYVLCVFFMTLPFLILGYENGLARTPPMGWLAWERFRCNLDCVNDPDNCISEKLFREQADAMVAEGYLDAGYEYLIVDDCWMATERDADGKLQADAERFPSGMKALADYVHSKGLKFGIYEDYGTHTCEGYPGVVGHLETDANTFAEWGADYVKLDGCNSDPIDMDQGYTDFGRFLNLTGRPMIYSCSWPIYQILDGMQPNYSLIIEYCNLWRNWYDVQDSWDSVLNVIDYYWTNQDEFIPLAGPGHWNDPDMLIIGDFGLSYEQSLSQMAIWTILASPLIMGNDMRAVRPEYKAILLNQKVIAVNQDDLGIQGRMMHKDSGIETWSKPINPVVNGDYSYAIAFLNRRTDGTPMRISRTLSDLGLTHASGYTVQELFTGQGYGLLTPDDQVTISINPTGTVLLQFTIAATAEA